MTTIISMRITLEREDMPWSKKHIVNLITLLTPLKFTKDVLWTPMMRLTFKTRLTF